MARIHSGTSLSSTLVAYLNLIYLFFVYYLNTIFTNDIVLLTLIFIISEMIYKIITNLVSKAQLESEYIVAIPEWVAMWSGCESK